MECLGECRRSGEALSFCQETSNVERRVHCNFHKPPTANTRSKNTSNRLRGFVQMSSFPKMCNIHGFRQKIDIVQRISRHCDDISIITFFQVSTVRISGPCMVPMTLDWWLCKLRLLERCRPSADGPEDFFPIPTMAVKSSIYTCRLIRAESNLDAASYSKFVRFPTVASNLTQLSCLGRWKLVHMLHAALNNRSSRKPKLRLSLSSILRILRSAS
jgi:hypothetical protein